MKIAAQLEWNKMTNLQKIPWYHYQNQPEETNTHLEELTSDNPFIIEKIKVNEEMDDDINQEMIEKEA
ncbi:hypothetical protein RclHR1_15140005 [Rhizophagus clarus]|nr:hypothetical protein RclHR1_15140005 [Rhizophagus clarus]